MVAGGLKFSQNVIVDINKASGHMYLWSISTAIEKNENAN